MYASLVEIFGVCKIQRIRQICRYRGA